MRRRRTARPANPRRGRPWLTIGDLAIGAMIQAMENDQSRDALSDREALENSGLFEVGPPAAFTLRRAMIGTDLTQALCYVIEEIGKSVYPIETGYVLDATYFKTRYYEKKILVKNTQGKIVREKVKNAKVYFLRGLDTGVPVVAVVADHNVNDQTVFPVLFNRLKELAGTAHLRGRLFIGDAGFNKQEHFEMVHRYGGHAFFDFDSDSKHSGGKFPHYDEMYTLRKKDYDTWAGSYNLRNRIESSNHAIKTLFKREFRARKEVPRANETLALLAVYAISRLPWLRLEKNIDLPFADKATTAMIDEALKPKRERKSLENVGHLCVREWMTSAFPWIEVLA